MIKINISKYMIIIVMPEYTIKNVVLQSNLSRRDVDMLFCSASLIILILRLFLLKGQNKKDREKERSNRNK
jgi:hypothetical protein